MRSRAVGAAAVLLLLVAPAQVSTQQMGLFVGGAATVPLGGFGDVARLGYQGSVGGTVEIGGSGFAVGAAGFYGRNRHEVGGERSGLYGVSVLAGYTVAEPHGVRLRAWAGLGAAAHSSGSDGFPGLNSTKRGLSMSGGGTLSRPLGGVAVFLMGLYTRGVGKLDTAAYPTELLTLGAGVSMPLSVD